MSDAESQEPVESNDLQGFISDDYSHILVYPKGSYPEVGVDLYTAPPKREWVGLTKEEFFRYTTHPQQLLNKCQ
jgi:hypothetical protein